MTKEELIEKITEIYLNLTTDYEHCNYTLIGIHRSCYDFAPTELVNDSEVWKHTITIILNCHACDDSGLIIPEDIYDDEYSYIDFDDPCIGLEIDGIHYPVYLSKKELGESFEGLNKIVNEFQENRINDIWMATKSTEIDSTDDLD